MRLTRLIISFIILVLLIPGAVLSAREKERLPLEGEWQYRLLGAPASIPGEGQLNLPNTLDNAHRSVYNPESDNTSQLRREFSFAGEATYLKSIEIPKDWEGQDIYLFMERTRPSKVRIDGKEAGKNSRISSPQIYNLTEFLKPGSHTIEISVNNADSIPPIVARSSHAASESTQTNWNGILGDFYLFAKNPFHIINIDIKENETLDNALINIEFNERAPEGGKLTGYINGKKFIEKQIKLGSASMEIRLPLKDVALWSAANPTLHNLSFSILDNKGRQIDSFETVTGFRHVGSKDRNFTINGEPVFLRGTVNAAVFPQTTYPPLDVESWMGYYQTLQNYGINHVRFHSWTPPEAAFEAADKAGMYLLTELPLWGELDRDLSFTDRFLYEDMRGIMNAYGTHPSLILFSPGNELWGDISLMGEYMKNAKSLNPRMLATYGTNLYLGMNGQIGGEDFVISSKTDSEMHNTIRGSDSYADTSTGGILNSMYPNSNFNFAEATQNITVPLISHEVGQYQSYPDFAEIDQYTGNLKADNLKEFKKRAIEAGTFPRYQKFHDASGKWAAKLYKAEVEMALRSPGIAGFELFGIQDYPGQGTSLVGLLNPFMQSKGFITPEEFQQSSSDVTLLAEFPKFCFNEGETVDIPILTVNYSGEANPVNKISWNTGFTHGEIAGKAGKGIVKDGTVSFRMPNVDQPKKMTFTLSGADNTVVNHYDFWIFPTNLPPVKNVKVTDNVTEALLLLGQGDRVILCPDSTTVAKASLDPLFVNDFWNYRMFRTICDEMNLTPSPGTLGLYINADHPALSRFPTDEHTDWQWYAIVSNSRPLIIDRLPKDFTPVVEVIDNVERNFRLALLLECNVEKGKLMILSANLKELEKYPEGKWLLQSLKEYVASKEFKPGLTLSPDQLVNLLTKPSNARLIKELRNETYNSHWD